MGIVFRQSVKSTLVIFTGSLIGALVNYYSTYVFKDDLQQLGFSRTILSVGIITMVALLLGAASIIQTYTQRYPATDERKKVLITCCTLMPVAAAIVLLPFYLVFKEQIIHLFQAGDQPYFETYYLWIPVLVVTWSYLTLYEAYMISQHRTAQAILIREVFLRLCNLGILAALYFRYISFHGFMVYTILSYPLAALLLLFLSSRTEGFGFSLQWKLFSRKEYKELIHFSWYHLLMGISFYLIGFLDVIMLAILDKKGVASIPVYNIAVFIVALMIIPYRAMTNATFPVLNRAYIDRNQEALQDTFKRSGINILIAAVAMAMIVGLNLSNAVAILPKGYEPLLPLGLILMLGRMADMVTGLNNEVISISNLYKFNFRISIILLLLILILNWILIPRYGIYGAAWGTTISLIVFNVAKLVFLQHKMKLQPFTRKSLLVLLAGIAVSGLVYFIPFMFHPVLDALLRTGIIVGLYIALLLWLRPSEDINTYLISIRKNKRFF